MTLIRFSIVWASIILLIPACGGGSDYTSDPNQKAPLFAEGHWFRKPETDLVIAGTLRNSFAWNFDQFGFTTSKSRDQGGMVSYSGGFNGGGNLSACDGAWCVNGALRISFEIESGDTVAYFAEDAMEGKVPFIRVIPPDLGINDNPDWLWRKLYFPRKYQCRYPRIDSTFQLSLDENGRVKNSMRWVRYQFQTQQSEPLVSLFDQNGQAEIYRLATYPGSIHGFTLHDVLNSDDLKDAKGVAVLTGDLRFEFVAE